MDLPIRGAADLAADISDLPAMFDCMASSDCGEFDLFQALCSQPDLLELVVQQCNGHKNNLRLACSRLREAVDACVTRLAWKFNTISYDTSIFSDFNRAEGAKHMAVFARCPQLQTLYFSGRHVADLSPLATCNSLRWIYRICVDDVTPFMALTRLEHIDCSSSAGLSDISALTACKVLKCLDCSRTNIKQLPPLSGIETLICSNTPLTNISALVACTALKYLDCSWTRIKQLPHLPCLETLMCRNAPSLSDISALVGSTTLKHLNCCYSGVTILPPLPASLETLSIVGTQCADFSPLAACHGLRSLDCSGTAVRDLAPLAACASLENLKVSGNHCTDLSPLSACVGLRSLDCSSTSVHDLDPLAACVGLRVLRCKDTLIGNIMPMMACKQLEFLECDSFDGVIGQIRQLHLANPDLDMPITGGNESEDA